MAKKNLNSIFLSASIPYADRDRKYYETADIVAIRDAVRALATVVVPTCHLIWGGHPSITPLIRFVCDRMNVNLKDHVSVYQSLYFEDKFPEDNFAFENIILSPRGNDMKESLAIMRKSLMKDNSFVAGIFIGGMEGIEDEFQQFKEAHPEALTLPIASTGAAARILFDRNPNNYDTRLVNDYAYMAMFRDLLSKFL
jgi:hypothetical protein